MAGYNASSDSQTCRRCGFKEYTLNQPYNNTLRTHRRYMYTYIGSKTAVSRLSSIQDVEARRFLLRTLKRPRDLDQNLDT